MLAAPGGPAPGDAELLVAGGMESMSRAPYSCFSVPGLAGKSAIRRSSMRWSTTDFGVPSRTGTWAPPRNTSRPSAGVTRAEQDRFSVQSQKRAVAAWENGAFTRRGRTPSRWASEPKAKTVTRTADEGMRPETTAEGLGETPPGVSRGDGTVTAGNASTLSDAPPRWWWDRQKARRASRHETARPHRVLRDERSGAEKTQFSSLRMLAGLTVSWNWPVVD